MSRPLRIALELALVTALCCIAVLATRDHARDDTATFDEPLHVLAGAEYVLDGTYSLNAEHPPLTKDLAGLALAAAGMEAPRLSTQEPDPVAADVVRFYGRNRRGAAEIIATARQPFAWLLAALVIAVYLAARAAAGIPAAALAASVIALDPTLIAHAGIVHTDVACALFVTLTLALAIGAGSSAPRWALAGVSLGLAILAKFTAILLLPLVLLTPLLLSFDRDRKVRLRDAFAGAAAACIVAVIAVFAGYAWNMRSMSVDDAAASTARYLLTRGCSAETAESYARLTRLSPPAGKFLAGVRGVHQLNTTQRGLNYLRGQVSRDSFPAYFPTAFAVKSTPAMLALAAAALLFGGRLLRSKWIGGFVAAALLFFLAAIPSAFNIGVRHILPVYPLLAVAGAAVLSRRLGPRTFAAAALCIAVSAGWSLARIHPYELGYFNAFAGGVDRGSEWLVDSNLDWGQDVGRLRSFLEERGWRGTTAVIVFGEPLGRAPWLGSAFVPSGRYALSATMERLGPELVEPTAGPRVAGKLREVIRALHGRGRRVARVGASITIWELGPGPDIDDDRRQSH